MKTKIIILTVFAFMMSLSIEAQQKHNKDFQEMEKMQDANENYFVEIYRVVSGYPNFSYKYIYNDGKLDKVVVEGIDNAHDKNKVEFYLYELKNNELAMKNMPTRTGIYYAVDKEPEPKMGYDDFYNKLYENIEYPEGAENAGVEGWVYVKFIVNSKGEIPFIVTAEDIETSYDSYVVDLKEEARKAVKATSGMWEPGEVENVDVASLVVLPVHFDFQKNPTLPALIR